MNKVMLISLTLIVANVMYPYNAYSDYETINRLKNVLDTAGNYAKQGYDYGANLAKNAYDVVGGYLQPVFNIIPYDDVE